MDKLQALGANTVGEAFDGKIHEAVTTLLAAHKAGHHGILAGGQAFMVGALEAMRKACAPVAAAPGLDARAAEFLAKGLATIECELLAADADGLAWRMAALADTLHEHRRWIKSATVVGDHAKEVGGAMPVRVIGMPARESLQTIERDGDGEIVQTLSVSRDVPAPATAG